MREIRFRAKTIKGGQWIEGDLFRAGTEPSDGEFAISYWGEESGWMYDNVRPDTIGQFTGLHDKNGKEIFEGDIVIIPRVPEKRRNSVLTRHIVTSDGVGRWYFKSLTKEVLTLVMSHTDFDSYRFEVIGNIHDNPELNKTISLNLPEQKPRKPRPKDGIQVEFVVKDNPKPEAYIEHTGKHSAKIVLEMTQEQMNKAIEDNFK